MTALRPGDCTSHLVLLVLASSLRRYPLLPRDNVTAWGSYWIPGAAVDVTTSWWASCIPAEEVLRVTVVCPVDCTRHLVLLVLTSSPWGSPLLPRDPVCLSSCAAYACCPAGRPLLLTHSLYTYTPHPQYVLWYPLLLLLVHRILCAQYSHCCCPPPVVPWM